MDRFSGEDAIDSGNGPRSRLFKMDSGERTAAPDDATRGVSDERSVTCKKKGADLFTSPAIGCGMFTDR